MHSAFKSVMPSINYMFKDGSVAAFVNGLYHTDDINKINELMEDIVEVGISKSKHPTFYVDENEQEVDPEALTPYAIMEKQVRAKLLLEMENASNPTNDRGETNQQNFSASIGNTVTGAPQVSSDKGVVATLASLKAAQQQQGAQQAKVEPVVTTPVETPVGSESAEAKAAAQSAQVPAV